MPFQIRGSVRAIGFAVLGFALYSFCDMMMKSLTGFYPMAQTVFVNSVFALIPITSIAVARGGWRVLRPRRPLVHLARAAAGFGTGVCALYGFVRMSLAEVYAILFAAPLIITAISALLLRERVDFRRWIAILVGFAGVLAMLRPDPAGVNHGVFGAIAAVLCYSASALIVRHGGTGESPFAFSFSGAIFSVVVTGLILPWVSVPMPIGDVARLAGTGCVAGLALICLMRAYHGAPSSVVAPFQYSQMIWGMVLGWLVFGDVPGPALLVGGAIVAASGIYIVRGEAATARRAACTEAGTVI